MSLINKVSKILNNPKEIEDISYLPNKISYDDDLSILDINLKEIIPNPPKNTSITTKKELEQLAQLTKNRTRKELDLIMSVDEDPLNLFHNFLDTKKLTFPHGTFEEYFNVMEQYVYALKYYYNRARPEQLAPYLNLDIDVLYTDTHHTASYPSGHTMYSELAAYVVSEKYPEYRNDFFKLSKYCGLARILQGVHYPSDNEASRIAVKKLYPLIKEYVDEQTRTSKDTFNRQPET